MFIADNHQNRFLPGGCINKKWREYKTTVEAQQI
jgi:hypothetical protein